MLNSIQIKKSVFFSVNARTTFNVVFETFEKIFTL